jgi:hypothetical protein
MSKQIILDALASQFAVKQNEFVQYETTVYQPALEGLNKSISDWFSSVLSVSPHSAKYTGDTLEIVPMKMVDGLALLTLESITAIEMMRIITTMLIIEVVITK